MRVIVDTSVWSMALRRRRKQLSAPERAVVLQLRDLSLRRKLPIQLYPRS